MPSTEQVDHALDIALAAWQAIPEVVQAWSTWSEGARESYLIDWPVIDDYVRRLRHFSKIGQLDQEQRARFADLEFLIAGNHAAVDALFASGI